MIVAQDFQKITNTIERYYNSHIATLNKKKFEVNAAHDMHNRR